jgi:hypothetical protein
MAIGPLPSNEALLLQVTFQATLPSSWYGVCENPVCGALEGLGRAVNIVCENRGVGGRGWLGD